MMDHKITVSMTSYPKRIGAAEQALRVLKHQTVQPDRIVLYLIREEFGGEQSFPWEEELARDRVEVHWEDENLKPHNKYVYAMREYPEDSIITLDDDILYGAHAIEELVRGHVKYPESVIARRCHLITREEGDLPKIASYDAWFKNWEEDVEVPKQSLFATGVGAVLYPPSFRPVSEEDIMGAKATCLHADDIWLKLLETEQGVDTVFVRPSEPDDDETLGEFGKSGLFTGVNASGGNDRQLLDAFVWLQENRGEDIEGKILAAGLMTRVESFQLRMRNQLFQELKKQGIDVSGLM